MTVKQITHCDFVCWTTKGLFVERIYQDKEYAQKNIPRFREFFLKYLLPELLTQKHRSGNSTDAQVASAVTTPSSNGTRTQSNAQVACSTSAVTTPSTSSNGNPTPSNTSAALTKVY